MKRELHQAFGLLLALLALAAQLTVSPAQPQASVSLAGMTVLCRHGNGPIGPPTPAHPVPDCQLCFVCHSAADPPGVLTAAPVLPGPGVVGIASGAILPLSVAPPARFHIAARPRGPPILV